MSVTGASSPPARSARVAFTSSTTVDALGLERGVQLLAGERLEVRHETRRLLDDRHLTRAESLPRLRHLARRRRRHPARAAARAPPSRWCRVAAVPRPDVARDRRSAGSPRTTRSRSRPPCVASSRAPRRRGELDVDPPFADQPAPAADQHRARALQPPHLVSSSQCEAMSSRQSSTASHVELTGDRGGRARHPPHLGERLARAAATPCSACTPSRALAADELRLDIAMLAPQSMQRPAMFSPAEPPPITTTSNCSTGSSSVCHQASRSASVALVRRTPEWRHDHSARHRHRRHRHQGCPGRHPQRAAARGPSPHPHPAPRDARGGERCRRRAGRVLRVDGTGRRDVPGDR